MQINIFKTIKECVLYGAVFSFCNLWSIEENFCIYDDVKNEMIFELGEHIDERVTPCSTFKIALSLIGFDTKILESEESPEWPFLKGYYDYSPAWRTSQNPQSWMKNGCVWYSQVLASQLGQERIQKYLKLLEYGNQDISGGLTEFWLTSSLKISPREQIFFIHKMLHGKFQISKHAVDMTKSIVFFDELSDGWKIFGKRGLGLISSEVGKISAIGWFVGWIEKNEEKFLFAYNIIDKEIIAANIVPRVQKLLREYIT